MNGLRLVFRALVLGPAARHPLRAVLPAIGVAIGVSAVAAIHYANRSVTLSFRDAAATIAGRSDFVVIGVAGVPLGSLPSLAFLWRYGSFTPAVSASAVIDDGSGEIAQILGIDPGGDQAVRQMKVVGDLRPAFLARGSVFVSKPFARRHGLSVGGRLSLVAGGVRRSVAIAGLLELSGVARAAGGDLVVTDIFTAQRLLGRPGLVDRVDIVLDSDADRERIAGMIRASLPAGLTLQPPGRSAATADRMVRAFRFNLNALGSLTLLVGVFSIANAVSISVLRRRPEIATLKAVGASRGILFAVFVAEGLAIGAAGTLVGEIGGLYLARFALQSVARTIADIYLPTTRIAGSGYGSAAALAAAVGMASALAATLLPAAEATRTSPSPALRAGSIEAIRQSRLAVRTAAAAALLVAAAAASLAGPIRGFPFFGFLAVAGVVAALALAAPAAVLVAAHAAKGPLTRIFGASGRLAAGFFGGSLARNGVAVAALALALGMTLAMIVTVSSIRETVRVWVESTLRSDLFVKAAAGRSKGFVGDLPEDVVGFLRSIPGVDVVDPLRVRDVTDERGRPYTVGSGDFAAIARIGGLPLLGGSGSSAIFLAAREKGDALVSEPFARRFSAPSGSVISLATPHGPRRVRVAAVYRDYSNDRGTVMIDRGLYLSLFGDSRVTSAAVLAVPGADVEDLRRRILAASQGKYALSVSSNRDLRRAALTIFDQTFAVTRALESIAVFVAILGVANALLASAVERRRSFGLLRALGAASGQIRATLLLEAGLSGVTATVAAACAGAAFSALLLEVINPQSFGWTVVLNVPVLRLAAAGGLVLAAAIGAGLPPGRVAASVDPAAALAEE